MNFASSCINAARIATNRSTDKNWNQLIIDKKKSFWSNYIFFNIKITSSYFILWCNSYASTFVNRFLSCVSLKRPNRLRKLSLSPLRQFHPFNLFYVRNDFLVIISNRSCSGTLLKHRLHITEIKMSKEPKM